MIYRKRIGSDTWHYNQKCRWWPAVTNSKVVERKKPPTTGELCNQCRSKTRRDKGD